MLNINKTNRNQGFSAMHIVLAIGIILVLALFFFGLPQGVKDFFANLRSGGTASISSFGEFERNLNDEIDIDSVANTIVKDLKSVQDLAKSEEAANKHGVCFKNTAEADFYNVVSNVKGSACDVNSVTIKQVVSLPRDIAFENPFSGDDKSVVFDKDGSTTASGDLTIEISTEDEARVITITSAGEITYSVLEKESTASPSTTTTGTTRTTSTGTSRSTSSGARTTTTTTPRTGNTNGPDANALNNIALGLANIMKSFQELQASGSANSNVPSQPALIAQGYNGYIYLSWMAPSQNGGSNITNYRIYRGTSPSNLAVLTTVPTNLVSYYDYSVSNGVEYYYRIMAINALGREGLLSNLASAVPTATQSFNQNNQNQGSNVTFPSAPTNFYAVYSSNQVNLNWSEPGFAGNSYIVGYRVYRSVNGGSRVLIYDGNSSARSFTDYSVTANTNYCYNVSARNPQYEGSQVSQCVFVPATSSTNYSNPTSNTSSDGSSNPSAPSAPTALTANYDASLHKVNLNWSPSTYAGSSAIVGYNVYRTSPDGYVVLACQSSGNSCSDGNLNRGVTYVYRVSAKNSQMLSYESQSVSVFIPSTNNNYSNPTSSTDYSNPTSNSTTSYSNPTSNTGAASTSNSAPSAPTNLNAVYDSANRRVNLTWSPSSTSGSSPITDYKVFRSAPDEQNVILACESTSTTCSDSNNIQAGVTYYYRVSARNSQILSYQSQPATVFISSTNSTYSNPSANTSYSNPSSSSSTNYSNPTSNTSYSNPDSNSSTSYSNPNSNTAYSNPSTSSGTAPSTPYIHFAVVHPNLNSEIKWDFAAPGYTATSGSSAIRGFNLYVSNSFGGPYTLKEFISGCLCRYFERMPAGYYYFKVSALNATTESGTSNIVQIHIPN